MVNLLSRAWFDIVRYFLLESKISFSFLIAITLFNAIAVTTSSADLNNINNNVIN